MVLAAFAGGVSVEDGDAASVPERSDAGTFDAVLCHAIAPYVEDIGRLMADVMAAAVPGGIVSLVVKNRDALAMRPALQGRWEDVPAAADADAGGPDVRNRAHQREEVVAALERRGARVVGWYGIGVVSDALTADDDAELVAVLAAERAPTHRGPRTGHWDGSCTSPHSVHAPCADGPDRPLIARHRTSRELG